MLSLHGEPPDDCQKVCDSKGVTPEGIQIRGRGELAAVWSPLIGGWLTADGLKCNGTALETHQPIALSREA